jgi:betaine-aldehyde dehydrogenase/5-carboxymethyl-2-hydroxymuconic-semialdehyde dehydrogenase
VTAVATRDRVDVAGVMVSPAHFIGGERLDGSDRFVDSSPIDGAGLAEVACGGAAEVDRAVEAATQAFPEWAALGPAGRAEHLHRVADGILERLDDIAAVESVDCGMLLRSLRARVVARGARNFLAYADLAVAYEERDWRSNGTWNRVQRLPAGPAAVVTPWNAPFMLATWKVAPALAGGCTVVLKPAEWAPLSASLLADVAADAGLPPGVLNVVQGVGEEAGAALVAHPALRRVSFTGSSETGRAIGAAAAANLVPFTAELGGNGAMIVCEDADLDAAASSAARQYDDAGQVCLACTRLLVHQDVAERFLALLDAATDEHVLGDPRDDETTIAPLIHVDHLARVEAFVDRARRAGDEILRGGRRSDLGGLFYEPTLVRPRSNDSEIVQQEVFGPVLTIQTFADDAEAVALANSTPYGLSTTIHTSSLGRAERLGRAVRAGTVWVNAFLVRDLTAPFGGMGCSGIGREGGNHALDFYSDLKTLQISEELAAP